MPPGRDDAADESALSHSRTFALSHSQLAYVIYTSGSTGTPKGVAVTHGSAANLARAQVEAFGVDATSRVLQFASPSFDAAVSEVFVTLAAGGELHLPPAGGPLAGAALAGLLAERGITHVTLPPSSLAVLPEDGALPALRTLVLAGEALPAGLAARWTGRAGRVLNAYGPTEATVCATVGEAAGGAGATVPIGRPIENARVYVLDGRGDPAPAGVPGELYVGGAGVARGYLGRPGLTAERFVPDALSGAAGARLYRTGDRARWLDSGELEFLGRLDEQVKVRGFRVEPGEVEAALRRLPGVRDAVVVAREDRLVGYVVAREGEADAAGLRARLREVLPEHMVPSALVFLDALPVTPGGKADRRALPAPEAYLAPEASDGPRTPTEEVMAAIWADVLKLETVGAEDDFFALGGHSLLATRVAMRARGALGVDLPLAELFRSPTVRELAGHVDALRARGEGLDALPPVVPVPRDRPLPLSWAQQRLWFLWQMDPESPLYNVPLGARLRGPLDAGALARALDGIVRRHEPLRTALPSRGGTPFQRVLAAAPGVLRVADLTGLAPAEREIEAGRRAAAEAAAPFDLERGPLFRALLLRLGAEEHVLVLALHHVVCDEWSMGVLARELRALYAASSRGEAAPLAPLPVQYADFAAWQREHLAGDVLERQLAWWRAALRGAPTTLELPTDRPRPPVRGAAGATHRFRLPDGTGEGLRALARREGATPFMTLLAAFQLLLARWSGEDDLLVGTPVAGRSRLETEGLVGFFVNTLVLRGDLAGDPGFRALLGRAREATLGAHAHQDLPFERLVEELGGERDMSRTPLFQAMFALQDASGGPLGLPGLDTAPQPVKRATSRFDLSLFVAERDGAMGAALEYATDLFDAATVARMAGHLASLLAAAVADPARRVSELPLMGGEERAQVLAEWNRTEAPCPADACIHHLFAAQARRAPDAPALLWDGGSRTYAELDAEANRLARRLRGLGVRPETRVAICLERSPELVAAILAVLKAGGAYVPLDPAYPAERLEFMLRDSGASVLVTADSLAGALRADGVPTVLVELQRDALLREDGSDPEVEVSPDNLAYVIYTSGSTGTPKGVLVPHRGLPNVVATERRDFAPGPDDRVLQIASFSFDASLWDVVAALACGGALCLATGDAAMPGPGLLRFLREHGVTVATLQPSTLAVLSPEELPRLRALVSTGDACTAEVVARWAPGRRFFNGYGPTETTIGATLGECFADGRRPHIGRPFTNTRVYLLDRAGHPVPVGVAGEVHVGGVGVVRGYLGRPELTADRFVPDPFSGEPGARLYRTGDAARRLPDGTLDFVGRVDRQVKVRGFRVELGEVEAALAEHPAVLDAVVAARDDAPGGRRLVAYTVAAAGEPAAPAGLRAWLRERLPEYMVPAAFVALDTLPLTPNGKVDRRALPAPAADGFEAGDGHVPPRTATEEAVAASWAEVLGRERVGARDHFFELGGHSLLATQVVSRLRSRFGVELPVRALFEAPTVEGLAERVDAARHAAVPGAGVEAPMVPVPRDRPLPLSFAQQRLWFLARMDPESAAYNVPGALRLEGRLDPAVLRRTLRELARRHESLRTRFAAPDGEPVQIVADAVDLPLPLVELGGVAPGERAGLVRRLARADAARPFDLGRAPLLRAVLLRLDGEEHVLLLCMHHVVSDGWSMGVFFRELAALYAAFAEGRPSPLAPLPLQPPDFAVWQRAWLAGEVLERQLGYWRAKLAGAPAALELPTDRPRPPVQSFRGAVSGFRLAPATGEALERLARAAGATPFMVLLAAWQALLARRAGVEDVVVGSPIAGRNRRETEGMIGFFVNNLALRGDLSGDPSFAALLGRARETTLEAYAHQDLPFERLVDELNPRRDLSRQPVFQVVFALQNTPPSRASIPGLALRGLPEDSGTTKLDLQLLVAGSPGDGLRGTLQYATDLFDGGTMERMAGHFATLLEGVLAAPDAPLSRVPLLPPTEREALLHAWNDAPRTPPVDACVHELFAAQAARTPDAPALVWDGGSLSYAELDARAEHVAHALRARGVGPESRVAVCTSRGPEMVVAMLAALKAGGAYLPLDPGYPRERLAWMLEDSGARVVLASEGMDGRLPAFGGEVVVVAAPSPPGPLSPASGRKGENDDTADRDALSHSRTFALSHSQLAYVIYTSGSTGLPKGTMVPHAAFAARMRGMAATFGMGPGDRQLQFVSPGFDMQVEEVWVPLVSGGAVVLHPDPAAVPPAELLRFCGRHGVTKLNLPASYWHQAVDALEDAGMDAPASLRVMVTGAEAPSAEKLRRWRGRVCHALRSFNGYGPTEVTIAASMFDMSAWEPAPGAFPRVPMGGPLPDTALYVLDGALEPAPAGVPGELYVGGAGVSRGYLGRPELTAERFVPDPFSGDAGSRLYRTGDRVRRLADGGLEFLGRADRQLKVRGFRVETGEIEAALERHPAVREAVVEPRPDAAGEIRLAAYLVPEGVAPDAVALRDWLRERLPEHMVPSAWVPLDRLPLTPNGKTDRAALPEPEWGRPASGGERVAPRDTVEEAVAAVWAEVLGLETERVGVHDGFFDLGGNSLLLMRVHAALARAFPGRLSMVELFRHATVEETARALAAEPAPAAAAAEQLDGSRDRGAARADAARRRAARRG
jgi:amino acid adenylation domain-containing protein